ncbi:MAG TPA: cytochrome b N-terminal domain-containing protein [Candidatus Acidoferrales bacterium]
MRVIESIGEWLDARLQIGETIRETAEHPVPRQTASWFYVFGSAAFVVFILQILTGIMLALVYVPSAGEAWNSLQFLNHNVTLGWFIRAMHGWGSDFMVAIVLIHMVQVFLFGAYKFPRELTWVVGILLLLVTLGMAFTGQVLRFDQDAYWGLGIGASIASRVPIMGPGIVNLLLGGPIIGGATLSRFFALHVFVIPGLLISFVAVHLLMVIKLGINEWPMPGRLVRKATYVHDYHELTKRDGVPFFPGAVYKDLFFGAFIIISIAACAIYFGPFGPSGPPDPTIIQTAPRPDYFFLWLYAVLSLLPPSLETPALLLGPVVVLTGLILLPFVFGEGEKSWKRRPIAVMTILITAVALGTFTRLAESAPWSPIMNAWSEIPVPAKFLDHRTALERQGALVFQLKQCHNCHSLGDEGGKRGPALDAVAVRLTQDQMIRQVIQGGGNMPAYGKNLSPAETTALVAFLETLYPAGQAPARDASRSLVLDQQNSQPPAGHP